MNGQMKKSKREIVNEYIARVNPYEKQKALSFDLRGYATYIAEISRSGWYTYIVSSPYTSAPSDYPGCFLQSIFF